MENLAIAAQLIIAISIAIVWVFRFDNIIIEEPFNVDHTDYNTFNHGLPILYFNLKAVINFVKEIGLKFWEIFVILFF